MLCNRKNHVRKQPALRIGWHFTAIQKYRLLRQDLPQMIHRLTYRYDPPVLIIQMANLLNLGKVGTNLKERLKIWYDDYSDMVSMLQVYGYWFVIEQPHIDTLSGCSTDTPVTIRCRQVY